jgi:5'-3' exonuclease
MAKAGLVYGVATEDMDCLTFGCPKVIRHLMASSSSNLTINEFDLQTALNGLGIDMEQFIAVCILCGCDYCSSIKGIGPVRALQLIQKHKTIEAVLKELDPAKYQVGAGTVGAGTEVPSGGWQGGGGVGRQLALCVVEQWAAVWLRVHRDAL